MQKQEIVVEIFPDGRVEYRIQGIKGPGCESISALLEQVGTVKKNERTAEYDQRAPDRQEEINIGNG